MLLASFFYVCAATTARHIGENYSVFQLVFIRGVVAVVFLAPMLARAGRAAFHTSHPGLQALCGLFTYAAILCWFYAAMRMPVTEFFALQYTTPLFTIALAVLILRQHVGMRNWIATFIGFAGVLVILRPGLIEVSLGAMATLTSALGYASVNTCIKKLTRSDGPMVIVFYTNVLMLVLALPLAVFYWQDPSWEDWLRIIGVAMFSTVAFVATARAVAITEARAVQPVNFTRLPIAAVLGYIFFGEISDLWTWAGALTIIASTYYILTRETRGRT